MKSKLVERQTNQAKGNHRLSGSQVIIRAQDAGVWYGTLGDVNGRSVDLTNARRMWRWWAAKELTLSAVALYGLNQERELKIQSPVEFVSILDACEIILCTDACINSFKKTESYNEQ